MEDVARNQDRLGVDLPARVDDPFRHCPACALTPRTHLNDGTPVEAIELSAAADACAKCVRFSAAGTAQGDILPTTSTYLGDLADQVVLDFASNKLQSKAAQRQEEDERADSSADAAGAQAACATQLHCNRLTAGSHQKLDFHGIVGLVCAHIIPALGLFLPMPTYEQHYYYDLIFMELLAVRPDVRFIYLDLACRYVKRFERLLAERAGKLSAATIENVKLKLPWMHGFDHDMDCQVKHSGLYANGAGARVGEWTEHLWSLIKPFTKGMRYMSRNRWWDGFNLVLAMLTQLQMLSFPGLLKKRMARAENKQATSAEALDQLRSEAAAHGVNDLEAAKAELEHAELGRHVAQLSDKGQYVECILLLQGKGLMQKHRAALMLVLQGTTSIQVHAKGSDEKMRQRLEKKKAALQFKLDIPDDLDWHATHPDFLVGAAEVRQSRLVHYEKMVEEQVFKRRLLEQGLEQEESGKNSNRIKKRVALTREHIRQLLALRGTWLAYGTNVPEPAIGDALLNAVCYGDFPWGAGGTDNGNLAARVHYARRYRTAVAHEERTRGEQVLLRKEVIRTINWLEEQSAAINVRLAVLGEKAVGSAKCRSDAGQMALLQRELCVLQQIAAAAAGVVCIAADCG